MAKKEFKAESKRLMELMINSIYSNKEIFLRELISNASDAIDKIYYLSLTDKSLEKSQEFCIRIIPNKEERILIIADNGIGMNAKELEENLGTIAQSGSLNFKLENKLKDKNDIIGQFGVGFYSSFMVANEVTVISKKFGSDEAYKWVSSGTDGYTISKTEKEDFGTEIILKIKENTKDENYDDYLEEDTIRSLIRKHSDFIKFPIKMEVTKSKLKEDLESDEDQDKKDKKPEYENYKEDEILNSMTPIWRKKKKDLKEEDYDNFYFEKHYGYDKPAHVIHSNVEGVISFDTLLYIPSQAPYDFYTKEYERGLNLYSNNVLILEKCKDLIPEYFGFVKGLVDSPDISLNISRELLQNDRKLITIAKNIKDKIKKELLDLLKNNREKYENIFKNFGRTIKYGVYTDWGQNKDYLSDLIIFYSSLDAKYVTLDEYVSRMKKDQKYIYYATGEDIKKIDKLPQTEFAKEKGYEIFYLTEEVDEFVIKTLMKYKDFEFKSVSSEDIEEKNEDTDISKTNQAIFDFLKEALKDKVKDVKASKKLVKHPVCITSKGELSVEMEKVLNMMPNGGSVKAEKILEINTNHKIFKLIKKAYKEDQKKLKKLAKILYNQALLIEGLPVDDAVEYANDVCEFLNI